MLLTSPVAIAATGQEQEPQQFGGVFDGLDPEQKRLVVDWIQRYNSIMGENRQAEETYNSLPLSSRTTYDAVTHALMTSTLTDGSGASLGSALTLVKHIDAIKGKVKGAGGDQQFRVYVQLAEGARDTLERSQEFKRGHDNTVYHKGYPLNYRQQGGVPSMQVSMSLDEKRADIDVDYRASKFPAALINGHLTSANSDVSSGNNFDRHSGRWLGLDNWWENWIGLPFIRGDAYGDEADATPIPSESRKGRGRIEEAVQDFLHSWLVEEKPELAMAYVSPAAFQCIAYEEGEEIDTGMAPFRMLAGMRRANQLIGKVSSLDQVATGIRFANARARAVEQPYHQQFVLYQIAESLALEFQCGNRGLAADEIPEGSDTRFDKYFGAVLHLQAEEVRGETLALLWEKQKGAWKLISFEVEPQEDQAGVPDLREAAAAAGATLRVTGDENFITAAKGFVTAWLIDRDSDKAMSFISPKAYSCVNLSLREGETPKTTPKEMEERLRLGLARVEAEIGTPENLAEAIEAIEPTNPDIAVVTHPDESIFSLMSMPDYLAAGYGCDFRAAGGEPLPRPEKPSYGDYYAQAFTINMVAGEPATLGLLWGREEGTWKITSYVVLTP
jgi:hypothetical protein